VIFTTAYDEHALRAFKVNAFDYLLKPIKKEELQAALARLEQVRIVRDHRSAQVGQREGAAYIKRFLIRYGDHFKVVAPEQIAYIHSLAKNTFLRTKEGRDLPLDESLDRLEPQLDPEKFFRINRQVIVQFSSIKELLAYSKSRVKVLMEPPYGEDAIVSSERSAEFKRWLAG
jgi:DNA-binding LytR/AlgR family response regulator